MPPSTETIDVALADDLGAAQLEKAADFLHVRLARGVDHLRGAVDRQRAENEVLGRGHRGVLEPHPRRLARCRSTRNTISCPAWLTSAPNAREHRDVRIDLARAERAALDLVLEPRLAEADEQAGDHHDRGAHRLRQAWSSELGDIVEWWISSSLARLFQFTRRAQLAEDIEDVGNVGDLGHVAQGASARR